MAEKNVTVRLLAITAPYKAAMADAGRSTQQFSSSATTGSAAATKGFKGMTAAAGLGTLSIAALAVGATKLSLGFEESFSKIEGLVGVASDEIAIMKERTLELAGETAKSPQELADALYFITSAGLSGSEALDALENAAKASSAGLGDTTVIADALTSAMNAYAESGLTAGEATDILVAAVREGKAEPEELAGTLGRVIPIAAEMGVEFDEVAAAIAAMSRAGIDADEGTTALRGILTGLLSPSKETSTALSQLGLSVDDVRDSLANDGLLPTLQMLDTRLRESGMGMEVLFPNVRALSGVLNLLGGDAQATQDIFDGVRDSTGNMNTAFEVAADSGAFKFRQAMAELQAEAEPAGRGLGALAVGAAKAAAGFLDWAIIVDKENPFEDVSDGADDATEAVEDFEFHISKLPGAIITSEKSLRKHEDAVIDAATNTKRYREQSEELTERLGRTQRRLEGGYTPAIDAANRATRDAAEALRRSAEAAEAQREAIRRARIENRDFADDALSLSDAQIALRRQIESTTDVMEDQESTADDVESSLNDLVRAAADVADQQVTMKGKTLDSRDGLRLWNRSMLDTAATLNGPQRDAILNHIARVNGIPTSRVTHFQSLVDSGAFNSARDALDWLARQRIVDIIARIRNPVLGDDNRSTGRATGGTVSEPMTLVGERGPELVSLPYGSRVHTNADSMRMLAGMGSGGNTYNLSVSLSGIGVAPNDVGRAIVDEIRRFERSNGTNWRAA